MAIFFGFIFLDQVNVCLHNDLFVLIVVFGLRGGCAFFPDFDVLSDLPSLVGAAGAAFLDVDSSLRGIRNHSSDVGSANDSSSTKLLPTARCEDFPPFCRCPGLPLGLVHWYSLATQSLPVRKEAFTCIAFPDKCFVFVSQLVPEGMEMLVVRSMNVVAQFMQHRVRDLFYREELPLIARVAETEADLFVAVDVQAKQIRLCGIKFTESADTPVSLAHDGFDQ